MRFLAATVSLIFLITFLATPTMGAGWFWDTGNAIGFAAFAGMLYLMITSGRTLDLRAHQLLGYAVLLLAAGHALWFLLGDAVVVEYVRPDAPDYMWFGVVSMLFLGVLVCVALLPDRLRVHKHHAAFKYWHLVLAIATVATASYHIVISDYYLASWYQAALLVIAAIALSFGRPYMVRRMRPTIAPIWAFFLVSAALGAVFVIVRNAPL